MKREWKNKKDVEESMNQEDNVTDNASCLTSNEVAISVRNLSKKYSLYDSPQHRLKEALHPFRKKYHHDFWH